ncbi:hypothetical protein BAZSYMA_ACONTIG12338_2 [Bathymodiolus azoricus thioautotrophic gill symbiont]|uniref:Uncharacterized protein n=1 Tax=Bathymodiolus azoricus thioautotrophic gill symbiont TaxID=235205 RepID=A0A1H6MML1_9GAMM|nr:hypothetical protein BAZSYMA_ACONTIG12338_2 [Bathymodiolus azoricus thioautotrophic gill symbiont]
MVETTSISNSSTAVPLSAIALTVDTPSLMAVILPVAWSTLSLSSTSHDKVLSVASLGLIAT